VTAERLLRISSRTVSTENATSPKSTRSRNSNSSVSCATNSNSDFGSIWICTEEFEFPDFEDFGGVALSVEALHVYIYIYIIYIYIIHIYIYIYIYIYITLS